MTKPKTRLQRVPWKRIMQTAKRSPNEWVLGAQGVPYSSVGIINRRENKAVRDERGTLEATMPVAEYNDDGVIIGDLYVRFVGDPGEIEPDPGEKVFRSMKVPGSMKQELERISSEEGITVSQIVRDAVAHVARKRNKLEPDEPVNLVALVDPVQWKKMVAHAESGGRDTTSVMRRALQREISRRS